MADELLINSTGLNYTELSMGEKVIINNGGNKKYQALAAFSMKAGAQTGSTRGEHYESGGLLIEKQVTDKNIIAPMDSMSITGSLRKTKPPFPLEDLVLSDLKLQRSGKVFSQHDEKTGLLMSVEGLYWRKHAIDTLTKFFNGGSSVDDIDISGAAEKLGLSVEYARDLEVGEILKGGSGRIFAEYFTEISDSQNIYDIGSTSQSETSMIPGQNSTTLLNSGFYSNFHDSFADGAPNLSSVLENLQTDKPVGLNCLGENSLFADGKVFTPDCILRDVPGDFNIFNRIHASVAGYWCTPVQVGAIVAATDTVNGNFNVQVDGYTCGIAPWSGWASNGGDEDNGITNRPRASYKGFGSTNKVFNPSTIEDGYEVGDGWIHTNTNSSHKSSYMGNDSKSTVTPALAWIDGSGKTFVSATDDITQLHGDRHGLIIQKTVLTQQGDRIRELVGGIPGLHYQIFDGEYGGYYFNFWEYWNFVDNSTKTTDHGIPPAADKEPGNVVDNRELVALSQAISDLLAYQFCPRAPINPTLGLRYGAPRVVLREHKTEVNSTTVERTTIRWYAINCRNMAWATDLSVAPQKIYPRDEDDGDDYLDPNELNIFNKSHRNTTFTTVNPGTSPYSKDVVAGIFNSVRYHPPTGENVTTIDSPADQWHLDIDQIRDNAADVPGAWKRHAGQMPDLTTTTVEVINLSGADISRYAMPVDGTGDDAALVKIRIKCAKISKQQTKQCLAFSVDASGASTFYIFGDSLDSNEATAVEGFITNLSGGGGGDTYVQQPSQSTTNANWPLGSTRGWVDERIDNVGGEEGVPGYHLDPDPPNIVGYPRRSNRDYYPGWSLRISLDRMTTPEVCTSISGDSVKFENISVLKPGAAHPDNIAHHISIPYELFYYKLKNFGTRTSANYVDFRRTPTKGDDRFNRVADIKFIEYSNVDNTQSDYEPVPELLLPPITESEIDVREIRPLFSTRGTGETYSKTITTGVIIDGEDDETTGVIHESHWAPEVPEYMYDVSKSWSIINKLLLPSVNEFITIIGDNSENHNIGLRCVGGRIDTIYHDLSTTPYKYMLNVKTKFAGEHSDEAKYTNSSETEHNVGVYLANMHNDGGETNHAKLVALETGLSTTDLAPAINGSSYYNKYVYQAPFGYILRQDSSGGCPISTKCFLGAEGFGHNRDASGCLYGRNNIHANWSPENDEVAKFVQNLRYYIAYCDEGPQIDIFRHFSASADAGVDNWSEGGFNIIYIDDDRAFFADFGVIVPEKAATQENNNPYNGCVVSKLWKDAHFDESGEAHSVGASGGYYNLAATNAIIAKYISATSDMLHKNFLIKCALWCKYIMRYNKSTPKEIVFDRRSESDSLLRMLSKGYTYSDIPFNEFSENVWLSKMSWSEYLWAKTKTDWKNGSGDAIDLTLVSATDSNSVYKADEFLVGLLPDALYRSYKQSKMNQYALNHFNGFLSTTQHEGALAHGLGPDDVGGSSVDLVGEEEYDLTPPAERREQSLQPNWRQRIENTDSYDYENVYHVGMQLGYQQCKGFFEESELKIRDAQGLVGREGGKKFVTYSKISGNNAGLARVENGNNITRLPANSLRIQRRSYYRTCFNNTYDLSGTQLNRNGEPWNEYPDSTNTPAYFQRIVKHHSQSGLQSNSLMAFAQPYRLTQMEVCDSYLNGNYTARLDPSKKAIFQLHTRSAFMFYYAGTLSRGGGMDIRVVNGLNEDALVSANSTFYMNGDIVAVRDITARNKLKIGSKFDMLTAPDRVALKCWGKAMFSDILITTVPELRSTNAVAVNFIAKSDIRLKKGVKTIPNALNKLIAMRGCEWNWKENSKRATGVIAQEMITVDKDCVNTIDDGNILGVNYNALSGYFIEAIKAQQLIINCIQLKQQLLEKTHRDEVLALHKRIDLLIEKSNDHSISK